MFPVNSDSVGCSPIFEIRESQQPPINNGAFGQNGSRPANNQNMAFMNPSPLNPSPMDPSSMNPSSMNPSPGPPFHTSNVNTVNMNNQNATFLQSQPGTIGSQDFVDSGFDFTDSNEMDISGDRGVDHPSPATISSQSRGNSTSQSSYSPGQPSEHHLPYRASPKLPLSSMHSNVRGGSTAFPTNYATSSEMYANTFSTSNNITDDTFQGGFMVGNEWDYTAMNTGTGMTPMADGSTWDSMLESVTMGWDSMGPPHGQSPGSR